MATVSTFINKNKEFRALDLPDIITATQPNGWSNLKNSGILGAISYGIINDAYVTGQTFNPLKPDVVNLDRSGVNPTGWEKTSAFTNTASMFLGVGSASALSASKGATVADDIGRSVLSEPANQTLYKQVIYPLPQAKAGGQFWMGKWYKGGQIMKGEVYYLQKGSIQSLHTISVPQTHPLWMKITAGAMIPPTVNWGFQTAKTRK